MGPLSRSVRDSAFILSAIAGYDQQDQSSIHIPIPAYHKHLEKRPEEVKIGIETGYFLSGADTQIADKVVAAFEVAEQFGMKLSDIAVAKIRNLVTSSS